MPGHARLQHEVHLILGGARIGDAEFRRPVALVEKARQHASERRELVEEPDAADAERVIPAGSQAGNDVGRVEDGGFFGGSFAARGNRSRERPRVFPRCCGCGKEAREERGVRKCEGETVPGVCRFSAVTRRGQARPDKFGVRPVACDRAATSYRSVSRVTNSTSCVPINRLTFSMSASYPAPRPGPPARCDSVGSGDRRQW